MSKKYKKEGSFIWYIGFVFFAIGIGCMFTLKELGEIKKAFDWLEKNYPTTLRGAAR